jgi:tripartite-type tricarboxylate transporter receptor subunit TctC
VSANLFKTLPFDARKDFAPISTLGTFELGLLTRTDSRFRNAADLLAYAKANPGKLNIGSINVGSTQHLAAELLKIRANVDFQVVPFNGSPAVLTALRGGQIDAAVEILSPVMPQVTSKALRVLAVTGEKRSPALPDVPTVIESGIAGYAVTSWNSLAAPARTPAPVIARLNREVNTALADPEVVKKLRELHVLPGASTPEQARDLLASEITRWGDVMTRAGIAKQ